MPTGFRLHTGSLATDFVATVGRRLDGGVERLTDPVRLAEWLVVVGLCPAPVRVDEQQLTHARGVREAVYRALRNRVAGRPIATKDRAIVNGAARHHPPVPQLVEREGRQTYSRSFPDDPVRSCLAVVVRDAIALMYDERAALLRACEATDCGMLFLDNSQSRGRRWCSMRECGNRAKVAAHRARHSGQSQ